MEKRSLKFQRGKLIFYKEMERGFCFPFERSLFCIVKPNVGSSLQHFRSESWLLDDYLMGKFGLWKRMELF